MALSIQTLTRSDLQCAPDTIGFYCDYTDAGFDAVGPAGDETYDARMCELLHFWSFGDATGVEAEDMYQYPTRNPKPQLRRSTDKGPFVAHVFQRPDTFTIRVTVIEPSTGRVRHASLEQTIVDADSVYADADTILVNNVGDSDFSEGIALWPDADTINVDQLLSTDTAWTSRQSGNPKRWLFKRGGTWTVGLSFDGNEGDNPYFGDYGTGAKPIWQPPVGLINSNRCISTASTWQSGTVPDMRIKNIRCEGGYDSTLYPCKGTVYDSDALWGHSLIRTDKSATTVITGCEMDGLARSCIYPNGDGSLLYRVHVDDCSATNMGGQYPIIGNGGTNDDIYISITGCALKNPDGSVYSRLADDSNGAAGDGGTRAIVRLEDFKWTHISKNDFCHMEIGSQPTLKLFNSPTRSGMVANVHSNVFENPGQTNILIGSNANQTLGTSFGVNCVVDSNICILGCYAAHVLHTFASGIQFRNNLMEVPATTKPGGSGVSAFVATQRLNSISAEDAAAAIHVYSNTMLMQRTSAQNGTEIPNADIAHANAGVFTGAAAANNIRHAPNLNSPITTWAPLSTDVLCAEVCHTGIVHCDTLAVTANTGIPADSILDTKPITGSSAIAGYSSGNVGRYDIIGRRHAATPDLGCWRVS